MKTGKIRQVVYEVTIAYYGILRADFATAQKEKILSGELLQRAEYAQTFEVPCFEDMELLKPNKSSKTVSLAKVILISGFDKSIFEDVSFLRIERVIKRFKEIDFNETKNEERN